MVEWFIVGDGTKGILRSRMGIEMGVGNPISALTFLDLKIFFFN